MRLWNVLVKEKFQFDFLIEGYILISYYLAAYSKTATEDVYSMLLREKSENEVFSDVISRLVETRSKLSDSFGK